MSHAKEASADSFRERFQQRVLPIFRKGLYQEALPLFRELESDAPDAISTAMLVGNIIHCHDALRRESGGAAHREAIVQRLGQYIALLNEEDAQNWPVQPAQKLFMLCLSVVFLEPLARAGELASAFYASVSTRFQPAFLEGLLKAFEQEATDYNHDGHEERAMEMGRVYLALSAPLMPGVTGVRVAIRSRMADLTLFSRRQTSHIPDRNGLYPVESEARSLLLASLVEEPGHTFSQLLQQHIEQRGHFRMQIARFWHDIRNRMAPLRESARRLRHMDTLPPEAHEQAVQMEKHVGWIETALRVSGAGHGANEVFQPDADSFREVDPCELCLDILEETGITGQVTGQGQPRAWELAPEYLRLAMTNLLNNSLEAYQRNGLAFPKQAIAITVWYEHGRIELRDWAGGLPAHIDDPFAPYASGKDHIHIGAGLGLVQARTAIVQQDGTLELASTQPPGGAAFVIQFDEF
jgi:signal transduction histidine kinase